MSDKSQTTEIAAEKSTEKTQEAKLTVDEVIDLYLDDFLRRGLDDELQIVLEVCQGLYRGARLYGNFNLGKEKRDMLKESREEERDWLIYRIAAMIKDRRACERGNLGSTLSITEGSKVDKEFDVSDTPAK